MLKYKHLHHYIAINSARKTYKCSIDDCNHTIHALIMPGRKSQCPICGDDIIIATEHLRRRRITCVGCGKIPGAHTPSENPMLNTMELIRRAKLALADKFIPD